MFHSNHAHESAWETVSGFFVEQETVRHSRYMIGLIFMQSGWQRTALKEMIPVFITAGQIQKGN